MQNPQTFVLVPGAWHGGWCYARVASLLRAGGHTVFTPTLSGVGERSHLSALPINLSTHIEDVLNLIHWEQLENVTLCGHSYGGMVIGAVADRVPDRIARLVYLDSEVPVNGKSFLDLIATPELTVAFVAMAGSCGGHYLPPFPAAAIDVNAADCPLVDRLCTPHPFATLTERVTLSGALERIKRKTYVFAAGWKTSLYSATYERIRKEAGWEVHEIACGHDVMLDAPQRVADILMGQM